MFISRYEADIKEIRLAIETASKAYGKAKVADKINLTSELYQLSQKLAKAYLELHKHLEKYGSELEKS